MPLCRLRVRWVKKSLQEVGPKSDMPIHRTPRTLGLLVLTLSVMGYLTLPVSMRAQAQAASGKVTDAPDGKHVKSVVNPKDGLTYVWIPAGTFQMGCSQDDT